MDKSFDTTAPGARQSLLARKGIAMDNPLSAVTIGSTVDMAGEFHSTVLADNAHVTQMVSRYEAHGSMRGQSDLVYTTTMNQGSASMSGSYGVSGVEKMTAAVSAYWGSSSGQSGKSTSVVFEIMMRAGFETMSFDALSPALLMGAMQAGPQQSAMQALQCYNVLVKALNGTGLVKALSNPQDPAQQSVREAYANWAKAAQEFRANYGESAVVGILWGGIGRAEMTIQDTASTSTWKYGGAAEFTYSGVGSSASAGATYDASGSSSTSNVTVQVTTDTMGACAKPYTDKWDDLLNGKAFEAIAKIAPLSVPALTVQPTLPKPPDFMKPNPPKDADNQVKDVKKADLDGVAKAAAYDRFKAIYDKTKKPGAPEFSARLDDFLKQAEQAPSSGPMRDLGRKVRSNQLSTLSLLPASHKALLPSGGAAPMVRAAAMAAPVRANAAAAASGTEDFYPIGVWVSNWSDLLPWLATGYLNAIDDAAAQTAITFRMMMQDFLTLSRLYHYAANSHVFFEFEPNASASDLTQIADSFFAQYETLAAGMGNPEGYGDVAADAISQLGATALGIYQRWDEIKFLRNAELGLGVLSHDGNSLLVPARTAFQLDDATTFADRYYSSAASAHCDFNPSAGNYSAFAQFYKLMPLILPTSRKIVAIGPGGILCTAQWQADPVFASIVGGYVSPYRNIPYVTVAIEFTPNDSTSTLGGGNFTLYPVPFSAAKAGHWLGQSFSTNVASDEDLNGKLKQLADDLDASGNAAWSYSSDALPDGWTGSDPYSRLGVRKQYFGLLPEPGGAF
jgi:hypothetical protein